jgi:hypothetical protein
VGVLESMRRPGKEGSHERMDHRTSEHGRGHQQEGVALHDGDKLGPKIR